ncbi:hypothetical protein D083_0855 [Dickeya solani RNS 08.23.3.1.A]|nr:hypothetical protein D083_0855 [Dickeya solani RNS 08.23.3.1.A]
MEFPFIFDGRVKEYRSGRIRISIDNFFSGYLFTGGTDGWKC